MQPYWVTLSDGSGVCSEGLSAQHAARIVEKVTGKKVRRQSGKEDAPDWQGDVFVVEVLPYPASPVVWRFDDPVGPPTPAFCFQPKKCAGKTACPRPRSCVS